MAELVTPVLRPRTGSAEEARVSVVIPTKDRAALLGEAVASVVAQTHRPLDLVIVDDGSEHPVSGADFDPRDLPCTIVRHVTPRGRNVARNHGLARSRGAFVLFLDDDDLLVPECVARLVAELERRPRAVAAAAGREHFGQTVVPPPWPQRTFMADVFWDLFYGVALGGPGVLMRRQALLGVGGLVEDLEAGEDWVSGVRLASQGEFVIVADRLMRVRIWGGARWQTNLTDVTRANDAVLIEARRWVEPGARLTRASRAFEDVRAMFLATWGSRPSASARAMASALLRDPDLLRARLFWAVHGLALAKSNLATLLGRKT